MHTAFSRFDDWCALEGVEVQVWQHGTLVRTGSVDTATSDSEVVWTASNVNAGRRLIDKASGYELRISRQQMILRRPR